MAKEYGVAILVGEQLSGNVSLLSQQLSGTSSLSSARLSGVAKLIKTDDDITRLSVTPQIVWVTNSDVGVFRVRSNTRWRIK